MRFEHGDHVLLQVHMVQYSKPRIGKHRKLLPWKGCDWTMMMR